MSEKPQRPKRGVAVEKVSDLETKKERLGTIGIAYYALGKEEKKIKASKDKHNKEIKGLMLEEGLYTKNGKHREHLTPLGDGVNNLLIQIQVAETIKPVDNVIDILRNKLGEKAEAFITKVEVLNPDAFESMLKMKLIKESELLDLVTSSTMEKLIVKEQPISEDE